MEIAGKYFRERKLTREETILTAAVAAINSPLIREYLSKTIRQDLPADKTCTILTYMGQKIISLLGSTDDDDIMRRIRENEENITDGLSASGINVPKLLEGYEYEDGKEAEHGDDNQH